MRFKVSPPVLFLEIRREFRLLWIKASKSLHALFSRYPRQIFLVMCMLIVVSGALCFTVLRVAPEKHKKEVSLVRPLAKAAGSVGLNIGNLEKMLSLKAQLDEILKKDTLLAADSLNFRRIMREIAAMRSH